MLDPRLYYSRTIISDVDEITQPVAAIVEVALFQKLGLKKLSYLK